MGYLLLVIILSWGTAQAQSVSMLPQEDDQSLVNTFESADLSAEQLAVFELRSQQLIREFVDYYELLRTTADDAEIQAVLRTELEQLLYDSETTLHINGLDQALSIAEIPFAVAPPLSIQSIALLEQGQTGPQLPWHYQLTLKVENELQTAQVTTVLFRQLKAFGTTTKEVWNVALLEWKVQ